MKSTAGERLAQGCIRCTPSIGRVCSRGTRAAAAPPDGSTTSAAGAVPGRLSGCRGQPDVWALGFTSLLTDVSSEMVASILRCIWSCNWGCSRLPSVSSTGCTRARPRSSASRGAYSPTGGSAHKEVATAGYALSAVCRVALLVAGSTWTAIAGIVAVDRIGKGIRTAPRDARSRFVRRKRTWRPRSGAPRVDAAGAMLGPFVAFALLALMPGRCRVLFALSFVIAICGVAVILLLSLRHRTHIVARPLTAAHATDVLNAPRFRAVLGAGSCSRCRR